MKLLSAYVIRRCFIADPGHVIFSADFDQIELRVAAGLAGETVLIEAAKRGESLHKTAALKLFGEGYSPDQYRYTKNVNFGWLFGGGPKILSEQANITYDAAAGIIKEYEKNFPALTRYKRIKQEQVLQSALTPMEYKAFKVLRSKMHLFRDSTKEGQTARRQLRNEMDRLLYRKIGYITTPFGRRLVVDAEKAYAGTNYEVQSCARDLMCHALLDVMADPELEPTVLLPIHDELLGQALINKAEYIASRYGEVMTRKFLGVPITASGKVYGRSWGDGYKK